MSIPMSHIVEECGWVMVEIPVVTYEYFSIIAVSLIGKLFTMSRLGAHNVGGMKYVVHGDTWAYSDEIQYMYKG